MCKRDFLYFHLCPLHLVLSLSSTGNSLALSHLLSFSLLQSHIISPLNFLIFILSNPNVLSIFQSSPLALYWTHSSGSVSVFKDSFLSCPSSLKRMTKTQTSRNSLCSKGLSDTWLSELEFEGIHQ